MKAFFVDSIPVGPHHVDFTRGACEYLQQKCGGAQVGNTPGVSN
jgi:hypothetical protein